MMGRSRFAAASKVPVTKVEVPVLLKGVMTLKLLV